MKNTKEEIIKEFEDFTLKNVISCNSIISEIRKHNKFMTNGKLFFEYNAKIGFMQKFRSRKNDVLKLFDFYLTFCPMKTQFWTITRKKMRLDFDVKEGKRPKLVFPEVELMERNLNQLLWRLKTYGVVINKYICVPEIKESGNLANYHYHMIIEFENDITKIRSNKKDKFRNLAYSPILHKDIAFGWINNPAVSEIWKEVTKDGSYRIKPEIIRKQKGVFHYVLSYLNKGIEYENKDMLPRLYFAMKSKKAYRIKGLKKMPKITYKILDERRNPVNWEYGKIRYVDRKEIDVDYQKYYIQVYKDNKLIEDKMIEQYFEDIKQKSEGNQRLSNFDEKVKKMRIITYRDIEEGKFSDLEIQKALNEGYIYPSKEGYLIL